MQICPSCGVNQARDGEYCPACTRAARLGQPPKGVTSKKAAHRGPSAATWRVVAAVLALGALACGVLTVYLAMRWRDAGPATAGPVATSPSVSFTFTVVTAPVTDPPAATDPAEPTTTEPPEGGPVDATAPTPSPTSAVTTSTPGPVQTLPCSLPASPNEVGLGSCGDAVVFIQQTLSACGFATPIDGLFGPETEKALSDFQALAGLAVDGRAGPKTQVALLKCKS